jgi:hypothetical protein
MLIISRFHETALKTCKFRDKFSEILREMQKRKLLEMTYIKKLLKSLVKIFSRQISNPAFQSVRLKHESS